MGRRGGAALLAAGLCLVTVLVAAPPAAAGAKGGTSPTGPSNLRITATTDTSVSLAWDAATGNGKDWWYLVNGAFRVDPPTTATRSRSPRRR